MPTLLGVINLSPESMVRDSIAETPDAIRERAQALRDQGVTILDVGARSITPDAPKIDDAEEQRRVKDPSIELPDLKPLSNKIQEKTLCLRVVQHSIYSGA